MNINISFVDENNTPVSIQFTGIQEVDTVSKNHYILGIDFMSSKWETVIATKFKIVKKLKSREYYHYHNCGYLTRSYVEDDNYATEDFYPILTIKKWEEIVDVIKFDKISNCKNNNNLIPPSNVYGIERVSIEYNRDLIKLVNIRINKLHLDKYLNILNK